MAVSGLPTGFGAKCQSVPSGENVSLAKSILAGQVGLYLTEAPDEGDPGGLGIGLIVAIVVGAIVVVAGAAGVYWCCVVKTGKDDDEFLEA
jgi:hypothetical protein